MVRQNPFVVACSLSLATVAALSMPVHGDAPASGAGTSAVVAASGTGSEHVAVDSRRALDETLPKLNVDAVAFSRVIDFLRESSGANIAVNWKVLEEAGVTKDTPVTLQVRDVTLRKMLDLVLEQASPGTQLIFNVDQNVIHVTTQDEADKHLITKVYAIDDLIISQNQNFTPPALGLGQTQSGTGSSVFTDTATNAVDPNDTPEKRGNDIAQLIRETVRPSIWKENGGTASIKFFAGKLIVTAPASVQDAIGGPSAPEGGQRLNMGQ